MSSSSGTSHRAQTYHSLFRKCLLKRTPVDTFGEYVSQLLLKSPLPSSSICPIILSPTVSSRVDPLHLEYIQRLVEKDTVSLPDVLVALLRTSSARSAVSTSASLGHGATSGENGMSTNREALEEDIFTVLATVVREYRPKSNDFVWAAIQALSDWMEVVMAVSGAGMLDEPGDDVSGMAGTMNVGKGRLEALAELTIAIGGNEDVRRILGEGGRKERKSVFQTSLSLFMQYTQVQNPALAARMDALFRHQPSQQSPQQNRNLRNTKGAETIDGMMMGIGDGTDNDGPIVWARGGLFVWLNGLLAGRPQVDDEAVIGYLYSRYRNDINTLLLDFVTAVLDVLSNAILRNEAASTLFLLRSFLTNKVPILLSRLSPSPMTASYALSQALLRTDASTLANPPPSLFDPYSHNTSTNPDMIFNTLVDLRQEFLFACALHGVVGEEDIQGIIGELPLGALPVAGKYDVGDLMNQCAMDPDRVERLLEEIEGVEGNSGAVVRTVVEIMRNMCEQKETMPLRSICSFLARKTSSLDVMLLFVKPVYLLEPLCELLDTWRYEEDQGEYQPVYEEFGYILLLVLTLIHRYDIQVTDLTSSSTPNTDSFIPQLLSKGSTSQRIENFESSDKHAQLGGWIREIFEGEGISDGLMSSCRPQDFYKLVPTLFMQSVMACERGVLDIDTLKEGFAFLLEPFLLPSLVGGLGWLGNHLWESHEDISIPVQILHSLLVPSSISPDASEVHKTVISISARQLERVLRELVRRGTAGSHQNVVEGLVANLRPYTSFKRNGAATRDELENWTHHAGGGGLMQSLGLAFQSLVNWSQGDINIVRPSATYTHRLVLATWRVLGARNTVKGIIGEVVKCRIQGTAQGYAEDIAMSMILSMGSPTEEGGAGGGGGKMGLLEALRAEEAEESGNESVKAEALRGVLRKVETQLTPFTPVHQHAAVGGGVDATGGHPSGMGVDGDTQDVDLDLAMGDDGMAGLLGDGGLGEGDLMGSGLLGDVPGMELE
ncbi:mediator complex, subunit Med5 [Tuber borchii]|uniref:Mediator of RNA polymerase II transcription subunit 5 n=1 Tax=Tuber borchii TaxID=42251 RepID=A0A2T6ZUV4_TUBBO|nr:mediator complex, subunit Med5 [Tuber borchii]